VHRHDDRDRWRLLPPQGAVWLQRALFVHFILDLKLGCICA